MNLLTPTLLLCLLYACDISSSLEAQNNPYTILNVKRTATPREIKQSYKRLVREWHPDKNKDPEASDKFVAIHQAYQLLSDPVRKERFDRYGAYDTNVDHEPHHNFNDIFNFAFNGGFGHSEGRSSFFEKHRVSYRMYTNSILEKSYTQPFIFYAYSTYCHVCYVLEPIWKEAVTDLESMGYGIGTVNYVTDGNLFEKLRVSYLPTICLLVEGRIIHYRGNMNNVNPKAIRLFARDFIPNTFLLKLNNYNSLRRFLDQWETTNKPSILVLGTNEEPRLRYLLLAMKFSTFARFAYVNMNSAHAEIIEMKRALGVKCSDCENIFIFKENPETGPVANLSAERRQFSLEEMTELISQHKLLHLPRASSMPVFDEFCPVSSRSLKYFCVLLPVINNAEENKYVIKLRKFIETYNEQLKKDRIHVATIFIDYQHNFISEFKESIILNKNKRSVLVMWRFEYVKAKYTWLSNIWSSDEESLSNDFETLKNELNILSRGSLRMDSIAKINILIDEYAPSWFNQMSRRAVRIAETVWFHMTKEELLPILSVAGTLFFIFFFGYGLNYLVTDQNTKPQFQKDKKFYEQHSPPNGDTKEWHPEDPKVSNDPRSPTSKSQTETTSLRCWKEMAPMIHELRAETYFGLIRLLKPGCRSIIILVDNDSKKILLPKFARHIYSLRNNKTFSFGYLMVDKNLAFFRTLLEHTLPDSNNSETSENCNSDCKESLESHKSKQNPTLLTKTRLQEINPKQTLGTVLVLCGWKLYFSMYHPMHKGASTKNTAYDSSISDDESDVDSVKEPYSKNSKEKASRKNVNIDNVIDGLPSFLDKMLEGLARRYYIPEWPDNLK